MSTWVVCGAKGALYVCDAPGYREACKKAEAFWGFGVEVASWASLCVLEVGIRPEPQRQASAS